jgi:hypothetical protein
VGAIINSEGKSSHWYYPDGTPCHQVPYKDKKRAGEMKNTTLRDARPLGLRPSVTNILGMLHKAALDNWKEEQLLIAASQEPYNPSKHVSLAAWMRSVHSAAQAITEEARAIGLSAHKMIEDHASGKGVTIDPVGRVPFEAMRRWHDARVRKVLRTESTVVHDDYAGTLDELADLVDSGPSIIDFKTRRGGWKMGKDSTWRCATYLEDQLQLAAYRNAVCAAQNVDFTDPDFCCRSVIVPSAVLPNTSEQPYYEHEWTISEMVEGRDIFMDLLSAWKRIKKYDPSNP